MYEIDRVCDQDLGLLAWEFLQAQESALKKEVEQQTRQKEKGKR